MARKLFCKLSHERGELFSVGETVYTIGADGYVEVADEHAPLLLQNVGKWADPSVATAPYKRPSGPPALILVDGNGNELSEEETAKAMAKALAKSEPPADPEPPAPAPPAPEAPPVEETVEEAIDALGAVDAEPAPADWPAMSTDSSKREMLANLEKLAAAGHIAAGDFSEKMNKTDLLEVIERAYDSMA